MSPKRSPHKSDLDSRWEDFKKRHRKRRRSFSSESHHTSDSDSYTSPSSSVLFSRFKPATSNVLFSPTKVYASSPITRHEPNFTSRSRMNLSFQKDKKRARATRKRIVPSNAISHADTNRLGPRIEPLVTEFSKRFQRLFTDPPSKFSDMAKQFLHFQKSYLKHLSPLEQDEFNSHFFKLQGMTVKQPQSVSNNKVRRLDQNRAVYMLQKMLRVPNYDYFEKMRNSHLLAFFTLNEAQSLFLWQTLEKLASPLRAHFWEIINKFAPARFFLQPTLQNAFVDVFSLAPNSSLQYSATLQRFAKFINSARDNPTQNVDSQIAFALTCLKRCDRASYHFIQGWLLSQLARGLAFTTLRTYCLHLSWFQQPSPKRYAKSQEFRRFLIQSVARFFTDQQDHGADAMDQETLTAFWKVFDDSNFSDAEYDKKGFIWILQIALRVVEAINNMWTNIDFNSENVGVVQKIKQAKNQHLYGKTYILALQATKNEFCPVKCLRYLAKHGSSRFVFYNKRKNRAWTNRSINKRFKFYVDQLPARLREGKKFTVYSLRSTFACSMAQANVDVSLIQQFMRQKSPSSTMTYIQKAFPHIKFANLLSRTSTHPLKESFSSSFLANLNKIKQI